MDERQTEVERLQAKLIRLQAETIEELDRRHEMDTAIIAGKKLDFGLARSYLKNSVN